LISDLLRIGNPLGRQVYQGHNTVETFKVVTRLIKVWGLIPSINLAQLAKDIEYAYAKRNEVAHGAWFRMKKNDLRLCLMREARQTTIGILSRRTIPEFAKMRAHHFNDYAKRIHRAADRIRDLKKFVRAQLQEWPRTVPSRKAKGSKKRTKFLWVT
jgi:hypothetical protein